MSKQWATDTPAGHQSGVPVTIQQRCLAVWWNPSTKFNMTIERKREPASTSSKDSGWKRKQDRGSLMSTTKSKTPSFKLKSTNGVDLKKKRSSKLRWIWTEKRMTLKLRCACEERTDSAAFKRWLSALDRLLQESYDPCNRTTFYSHRSHPICQSPRRRNHPVVISNKMICSGEILRSTMTWWSRGEMSLDGNVAPLNWTLT